MNLLTKTKAQSKKNFPKTIHWWCLFHLSTSAKRMMELMYAK